MFLEDKSLEVVGCGVRRQKYYGKRVVRTQVPACI